MTVGMIVWIIIVCLVGLGITGLIGYNIRSFIRKWKAIPSNWPDLLVGIVVWTIGAIALWLIIIKFVLSQLPA
jgi:uncharacterized membrane-anchored protein